MKNIMYLFFGVLFYLAMVPVASAVPIAADVLFIVDESGSMAGEHTWIGNMVTDLETGLINAGVGTGAEINKYGLIGFGATYSHGTPGHAHNVGGSDMGSAADLATAASGLIVNGGTEDGWQAIDYALNNYTFRAGAALNIILITDEDRDNISGALSYAGILASLTGAGAVLNSVVNCGFSDGAGAANSAIGVDSDGDAFVADGSGGFTTSTGGKQNGGCYGTTKSNYVDLAWATGGAAWDLDHLRAGGLTATSFSNAFVDIKVQEIIIKPRVTVPEPATLALMGLGLFGFGFMKKRKA